MAGRDMSNELHVLIFELGRMTYNCGVLENHIETLLPIYYLSLTRPEEERVVRDQ